MTPVGELQQMVASVHGGQHKLGIVKQKQARFKQKQNEMFASVGWKLWELWHVGPKVCASSTNTTARYKFAAKL